MKITTRTIGNIVVVEVDADNILEADETTLLREMLGCIGSSVVGVLLDLRQVRHLEVDAAAVLLQCARVFGKSRGVLRIVTTDVMQAKLQQYLKEHMRLLAPVFLDFDQAMASFAPPPESPSSPPPT